MGLGERVQLKGTMVVLSFPDRRLLPSHPCYENATLRTPLELVKWGGRLMHAPTLNLCSCALTPWTQHGQHAPRPKFGALDLH